jgi:hypothetical protein
VPDRNRMHSPAIARPDFLSSDNKSLGPARRVQLRPRRDRARSTPSLWFTFGSRPERSTDRVAGISLKTGLGARWFATALFAPPRRDHIG